MTARAPDSEPPYSAHSPFVRLLGTKGRVRVLDVFLRKFGTELSATEIAELTNVSESTFSRNKDVLIELDVIEPTRREAGKQYYELNVDSPIVTLLAEFHTKLIEHTDEIDPDAIVTDEDYIGRLVSAAVDSPREEGHDPDTGGDRSATDETRDAMLEGTARDD